MITFQQHYNKLLFKIIEISYYKTQNLFIAVMIASLLMSILRLAIATQHIHTQRSQRKIQTETSLKTYNYLPQDISKKTA